MKAKFKTVVGALLVTAVAAGATVVPASSQAGEIGIQAQPGQVCNTARGTWVYSLSNSLELYWLPAGAGFRILGYPDPYTYRGRGNGLAEGWIFRNDINQSSCHW